MGGCLLRLTQMWSAVERKRRDIYSICGLGKDAGFERKALSTSSSSGNSKKGGWKREGGPLRTVLAGGRERGDCWRRRERGVPVKERQWHRRREGGARKSIGGGGPSPRLSYSQRSSWRENAFLPRQRTLPCTQGEKSFTIKVGTFGNDERGKS